MLKPEPEKRGFQLLPRGPVDVNVSGEASLTSNNVDNVSKFSFSLASKMRPMRVLLGDVSITPLSGHIRTNVTVTSQNNACNIACFM